MRRSVFPADEALDDAGRKRAAAMAGHLPAARRYWTSPELRTRQTAAALGLDATVLPVLRDCDYGAWTGRSFDDVLAHDPEAISSWLRDPAAAPHGGEPIAGLMRRVAAWLDACLDGGKDFDDPSIVVTHGSIIRAAIVHAIGATPQSFWRIDVAPLSMIRLSGKDGRWNLDLAERRAATNETT